MDQALDDWCSANGYAKFKEALLAMGVTGYDDLDCLEDDDLLGIGMNLVQVRKLQNSSGSKLAVTSVNSRPTAMFSKLSTDTIPIGRVSNVGIPTKSLGSTWWHAQCNRPLRLIFIRHGESEANVDRTITLTVPDHLLHLTAKGREQALEAGERLKGLIGSESVKFTVSPYVRTRETLNGMLHTFLDEDSGPPLIREDVRIREQEFGNLDHPDMKKFHKERREFGAFYYRFQNGESVADCHDRASLFLETLYRSWAGNQEKNHIFVSHGTMILVTLMRFLKLDVAMWDKLETLKNCEFVVLEREPDNPLFDVAFTWAPGEEKFMEGFRIRTTQCEGSDKDLWDGSPDAPPLVSSK
mmetsp:Transcript_66138/g.184157  ORF Transcript_66138/g.184157 Transcript_66138/m.184157 type:complete len:355 (-) Transcript_66138:255-1319(-)